MNVLRYMSDFSITCPDFNEGEEIPKKFGYKFENEVPVIHFNNFPKNTSSFALIMDDPDAMAAVGKVWVHWLVCDAGANIPLGIASSWFLRDESRNSRGIYGKTDFGEIGYGGPAPPDKRHTYIFKGYALDVVLHNHLEEGYSKQELEDVMKGHILAEAKLTGTFAP